VETGEHRCGCPECSEDRESPTAKVHAWFNRVLWRTDEKQRRLMAALEAKKLGWGGITKVSQITGLTRVTIAQGIRELEAETQEGGRIRKAGAGRPRVEKKRRRDHRDAAATDAGCDRRRSHERDQVDAQEHSDGQRGTHA